MLGGLCGAGITGREIGHYVDGIDGTGTEVQGIITAPV